MNKFLISQASAILGAEFIAEHGGFVIGRHDDPMIGYFCALNDKNAEDWNSMGHGFTYDLAIVSLYFLKSRKELPLPKSSFYLEN
jgi:hypothetical protein